MSDLVRLKRSLVPFAQVPHEVLNDEDLSWKAKGLFSYLAGRPPDWQVRRAHLVTVSSDGKHSLHTGICELQEAGYLRIRRVRDEGQFVGTEWELALPESLTIEPDSPHPDFPDVENPDAGNPDAGNRDAYKEGGSKKEFSGSEGKPSGGEPPDDENLHGWRSRAAGIYREAFLLGRDPPDRDDAAPWSVARALDIWNRLAERDGPEVVTGAMTMLRDPRTWREGSGRNGGRPPWSDDEQVSMAVFWRRDMTPVYERCKGAWFKHGAGS
ncbi:MAG: hypothetical protein ACLFWG_00235 [Longimicrobiales bacterium]